MRVFRRIMLGSGTFAETQKLYYTGTTKVTPKEDSLGVAISVNSWNDTTGKGVIICSSVIEKIGNEAFYNCSSLTTITIPDSVTEIGESTFQSCTSLTNIIIPDSVTSIGNFAFQSCTSLTNIIIPDSVTSIGNFAFQLCTSLTNIIIPDSVTEIGKYTFNNCSSLTTITIPDSVTEIGESTFQSCASLTNIIIPDSVTSIGNFAFYSCDSMQYYDFSTHEYVPSLDGDDVFGRISSTCKIIVPDALYDEWVAAINWSRYASYIIKKSDWDASQTTE